MILSRHGLAGMTLPAGVFVYFEPENEEIGKAHAFLSAVTGAVLSSLRRIHMESTMIEEKDVLRKALQNASEEKQKAEDALRLNQELVDASPYGLCLLDENNRVKLENESSREARRFLDISGGELIQALKVDSGGSSRELQDAIESRREVGIVLQSHSKSFRVETKPILVNNWMLVMFRDISNELEEQRRKVAYARMSTVGNLAASMAHNMKSPLGAIHGFGSIIKDDLNQGRIQVLRGGREDEDFRGMILNIITGSENLLKIVNQLLNFTRKWDRPEGETDVEGFVEGLFQIISPQANSAGVKLSRKIGVDTVRIRAEALEQVLINLLINAVKASSQGSEVVLEASRREGGVEFTVRDFGIGMDQEQISKIFDPLYTAWPVKTGMGLGLSLAKDIIDSMGGRIDVSSSPGKGSVFTVWIPEGKG
jgi:signal transduction histidine kinase